VYSVAIALRKIAKSGQRQLRSSAEIDGGAGACLAVHLAQLASLQAKISMLLGQNRNFRSKSDSFPKLQLIHQIAFGEYLCQMTGGIQDEPKWNPAPADWRQQRGSNRIHERGITDCQKAGQYAKRTHTFLVELMQEQSAKTHRWVGPGSRRVEDDPEAVRRYAC